MRVTTALARLGHAADPSGYPALLAVTLLLALAGSAHRGRAGGAGPEQPVRAGATASATYRLSGCRSRAAAAVYHGGPARQVAFGFDDGPAPDTPALVAGLERAHAPATFFVIGALLGRAARPLLLRELRDGDALGDHTFTHANLVGNRAARSELQRTMSAIRALSGYTPCVFRPPYGAFDGTVVRTARSLGLSTVLWNVDPRDWATPGVGAIVRRVLSQVRPGSIVISHDGGGPRAQTLAAYPAIIAALRRRGYGIVTIPQLLGYRPVYVPCLRRCDGLGLPRGALPRDALIVPATPR